MATTKIKRSQTVGDTGAGRKKATRAQPAKSRKRKPTRSGSEAVCGIIMPISAIDNCSEEHWSEVRTIFEDAIETAGFEPRLVSDAEDVGIIQKRIIQN